MRIAVLGGDGYCGWATVLYLSEQGHAVAVIDNYVRRQWDYELGRPDAEAHPATAGAAADVERSNRPGD